MLRGLQYAKKRRRPLVPFRVVCADPPWKFGDKLPGSSRGAEKNYKVMTVEEICEMQLPPIADDAYLLLWRVSAMVKEAYEVVRAWGFTPKSEIVWQKLTTKNNKKHFGMGRHVRASHETAILAVRGRPKPLVNNIRSTFEAEVGRHSQKPELFYDLVEELSDGPYLELFARRHRPGWTCQGLEVDGP